MINQNQIFHNEKLEQITFLDSRYYSDDQINYYPSVTYILDFYPKGAAFAQWLKENGMDSERIAEEAMTQGSKVHDAIDSLHKGYDLTWQDDSGKAFYSLNEWTMILKYAEFFERFKPEVLASEYRFVDKKGGYGGTIDLVCKIKGTIWLIDYKTSKAIYDTNYMQVNAYTDSWNRINPALPVASTGILWLNAQTRGEGKGDAIQGKGWQLKQHDQAFDYWIELFRHCQAIFRHENPDPRPKNVIMPDRVKALQSPLIPSLL